MKFTIYSVCVLLLIITSIMIHSYKGYDKGVFRTLLSFATNVGAIILGILLSTIIVTSSEKMGKSLIDKFLPQISSLANSFGAKSVLDKVMLNYKSLVVMAGQFVLSALLTIPCFIIIKILLVFLVDKIFSKKLKEDASNLDYASTKDSYFKRKSKNYGAIVGGISGFLLAIFILSPMVGAIQTAERAMNILESIERTKAQTIVQTISEDDNGENSKNNSSSSAILNALNKFEIPYVDEFGTEFVYATGGKLFFSSMTNAKVLNRRTNIE